MMEVCGWPLPHLPSWDRQCWMTWSNGVSLSTRVLTEFPSQGQRRISESIAFPPTEYLNKGSEKWFNFEKGKSQTSRKYFQIWNNPLNGTGRKSVNRMARAIHVCSFNPWGVFVWPQLKFNQILSQARYKRTHLLEQMMMLHHSVYFMVNTVLKFYSIISKLSYHDQMN